MISSVRHWFKYGCRYNLFNWSFSSIRSIYKIVMWKSLRLNDSSYFRYCYSSVFLENWFFLLFEKFILVALLRRISTLLALSGLCYSISLLWDRYFAATTAKTQESQFSIDQPAMQKSCSWRKRDTPSHSTLTDPVYPRLASWQTIGPRTQSSWRQPPLRGSVLHTRATTCWGRCWERWFCRHPCRPKSVHVSFNVLFRRLYLTYCYLYKNYSEPL